MQPFITKKSRNQMLTCSTGPTIKIVSFFATIEMIKFNTFTTKYKINWIAILVSGF
jgi:hypothetical protein